MCCGGVHLICVELSNNCPNRTVIKLSRVHVKMLPTYKYDHDENIAWLLLTKLSHAIAPKT
ncbi:hypothetical protein PAJ34TS1_64580 [Paenibacillus azoreducens]